MKVRSVIVNSFQDEMHITTQQLVVYGKLTSSPNYYDLYGG